MSSNFDSLNSLTTSNTTVQINSLCSVGDALESEPKLCSPIDIDEAITYLKSCNLCYDSTLEAAANARVRWKSNFTNWICTAQKLNSNLKSDCDLIYAIAQCSFNWEDSIHWRMAQTVFKQLTGAHFDCPKLGCHWQLIGFQGSDPSTDLRGVGLFGLLQMLYLSTNESTSVLAQKLYKVANSESQPFPLAVLSLNVTQITMNTLRSGKLNKECNNRQSVLQVLNLFYIALLNYIFNIWVSEHKTIKDSGYLLKDAEKYCCKNVKKLIQDLPLQLEQHKL